MPEKRELAVDAATLFFELLDLLDRLVRTETLIREQRCIHDDERPLTKAKPLAREQVENRILVADTAAKSSPTREAECRVVIETCVVPVLPRRRIPPTQIVLAAAPLGLVDPELVADRAEPQEVLLRTLGIVEGRIARMESDLVPALGDGDEQAADVRIVQGVGTVYGSGCVCRNEIERASERPLLAHAHDQVERVVEIGTGPASRDCTRQQAPDRNDRRAFSPQLSQRALERLPARRPDTREIDVVTRQNREAALPTAQSGPQRRERGPEQLDVLVDERTLEEARALRK